MTANNIKIPKSSGIVSKQAHADLPDQAIYERELGRDGFFGPATHMHHQQPPTGWLNWEGSLKPRAFDLNKIQAGDSSPWHAATILYNDQCQIRSWQLTEEMSFLVRNGDGDDLLFFHQGKGVLYCDYGSLDIEQGDYVLLPRGTLWRIAPEQAMTVLMIEAKADRFQLPEKGLIGQHAIFDPGVLQAPEIDDRFLSQQNKQAWSVSVKRGNQWANIQYPFNPLDALGWHGDLYPVKLNCRDIRPVMSHRYHVPPSAHSTFVCNGFVVCTFVPRPIESDPGALKVPFYHSNEDCDEVLFYHSGNFFSRDNIYPGMITFHPAGFPHGPHPKAFEKARACPNKETNEVAVMVDTWQALNFTEQAKQVEVEDYVNSWKKN